MPKKVDTNQAEIVDALRKAGASVFDLHEVGRGLPDILVGYRNKNYLMEIKYKKGVLNAKENDFFDNWQGQAIVVYTAEQALRVIKIYSR